MLSADALVDRVVRFFTNDSPDIVVYTRIASNPDSKVSLDSRKQVAVRLRPPPKQKNFNQEKGDMTYVCGKVFARNCCFGITDADARNRTGCCQLTLCGFRGDWLRPHLSHARI